MMILTLLVLFIIAVNSVNTEPKPARAKTTTISRSDRPYGSVKYLEDM